MIGLDLRQKVTCIVVNWNGWQDTINCLNALGKCSYPYMTIIVVDNFSTNDSVVRIRAAHPEVIILESDRNLGFAGGSNLGIRQALSQPTDYVWLLNNDTTPSPDALSALILKANTDRRIGAVGSVCYYAQQPNIVQIWAGGRMNLWIGYAPYSKKARDDNWFHWLNGASLLVASSAFRDVGLFDDGFFLYWEDSEFCVRLRKKGWRIAAAPESRVLHRVAASSSGNNFVLDRYSTASGLRMLRLHSPAPPLSMFLFLIRRFAMRLLRLQFRRCQSIWSGFEDYRRSTSIRKAG